MVAVAVAHDPIMRYSADEWRAMAARKSLLSFGRRMFAGYIEADHIRRMIDAIERTIATPNGRLIITLPPRHSKSLNVSEHLPAWYLGNHPDERIIAASHTAGLAYTFSRRVRNKFDHPRWPFPGIRIAGDKASVQAWDIEGYRGGYIAVGVGGSPTGHGGNGIIIDDPFRSAADAESETIRESIGEWYQGTMRTRLEPGGWIILTATRWHEDDLTGRQLEAMKTGGEQWEHLHLPAISDDGRALWPERWPLPALERTKVAVGTRNFEAQYQGRPSPAEGGTFKRWWWKFWHPQGMPLPPVDAKGPGGTLVQCPVVPLPPTFDAELQSWDMSFKKTEDGSFVAGLVAGRTGPNRYLMDRYHRQVDFPDALLAVRAMTAKWPNALTKLVENKANGPAIVATLRGEIPGFIEIEPGDSKEGRANAAAPAVEAGNWYLPHPMIAPWVDEFIDELAKFPTGKHNDQVDAFSQAEIRLAGAAADAFSYSYLDDDEDQR